MTILTYIICIRDAVKIDIVKHRIAKISKIKTTNLLFISDGEIGKRVQKFAKTSVDDVLKSSPDSLPSLCAAVDKSNLRVSYFAEHNNIIRVQYYTKHYHGT